MREQLSENTEVPKQKIKQDGIEGVEKHVGEVESPRSRRRSAQQHGIEPIREPQQGGIQPILKGRERGPHMGGGEAFHDQRVAGNVDLVVEIDQSVAQRGGK